MIFCNPLCFLSVSLHFRMFQGHPFISNQFLPFLSCSFMFLQCPLTRLDVIISISCYPGGDNSHNSTLQMIMMMLTIALCTINMMMRTPTVAKDSLIPVTSFSSPSMSNLDRDHDHDGGDYDDVHHHDDDNYHRSILCVTVVMMQKDDGDDRDVRNCHHSNLCLTIIV